MENQKELRKRLKLEAKEKMRQSNTSPYLSTIIYGVIIIVALVAAIAVVATSLVGAIAVTGEYREPAVSSSFMAGAEMWAYVVDIILGIFFALMMIGYIRYSLKLYRGEECRYGDVFSGFSKKGFKALLSTIVVSIVTSIIVAVATTIATAVTEFVRVSFASDGLTAVVFIVLMIFVLLISCFLYYSFVFVVYIACDEDDTGFIKAVSESYKMMKGHKWELFKVDLSFIGWFILSSITLCIAGIYVLPYYYTVHAGYYDTIKNEYKGA